jgi:beta-lactam-binding protein with PASTA domain
MVPDVTRLRPAEAFDVLGEAGLQPVLIGVPTIKSAGNTGYHVAAQEPPAGQEVDEAARVTLALAPYPLSWGTLEGSPIAPAGTAAPNVVGVELEEAMLQVTRLGLIAVVFQPERPVTGLDVSRQAPQPGEATSFREVAIWLD